MQEFQCFSFCSKREFECPSYIDNAAFVVPITFDKASLSHSEDRGPLDSSDVLSSSPTVPCVSHGKSHGKSQPYTQETMVALTPLMSQIQTAILQMIESGLIELKKSRSSDLSSLNIADCLFKAFDYVLQNKLESVWHSLSKRLRRLVQASKFYVSIFCHKFLRGQLRLSLPVDVTYIINCRLFVFAHLRIWAR